MVWVKVRGSIVEDNRKRPIRLSYSGQSDGKEKLFPSRTAQFANTVIRLVLAKGMEILLPINTVDVGQLVGLIQDVIEFREDDNGGGASTGGTTEVIDGDWSGPQTGANAVQGKMSRSELEGPDDATVAIFPSQESGVEFLKENNAWGFVNINQQPEFVAMYVSEDVQQVLYVARVKEIVPATEATLARTQESYIGEQAEFDENNKVVVFEPGSLYELSDPIDYESRVPYSLRYTELGLFKEAETTDDIL